MLLKKIILEGDPKYEKENKLFPIRWKSHHITELFIELCPELELDGNGQLTILATRNRRQNAKKYNNYKAFHASSYYLDKEQIKTLELLESEDAEKYILNIIEEVLIDITNMSGKNEEKSNTIKATIKKMIDQDLSLRKKIKTLSKTSKGGKYKAEVFRCLNRTVGEAWCVQIKCGNSDQTKIQWLANIPDYLDRRDYFKKSRWEENKFIITNKLGAEVALVDVDD
ncbi:MAG: hypothetical protein E7247_00675 [Paenibacillaceae bacterium]|nr:hypothetical protein [Paenibacillaceae bacterium]